MNSIELKFLIDVGVGKGIENYLHAEGYDIKAVRDIDPCIDCTLEVLFVPVFLPCGFNNSFFMGVNIKPVVPCKSNNGQSCFFC